MLQKITASFGLMYHLEGNSLTAAIFSTDYFFTYEQMTLFQRRLELVLLYFFPLFCFSSIRGELFLRRNSPFPSVQIIQGFCCHRSVHLCFHVAVRSKRPTLNLSGFACWVYRLERTEGGLVPAAAFKVASLLNAELVGSLLDDT